MTPDFWAATGLAWLWRASWQASVLVLLVLLAQWACRARLEPRWRFALWWLVLLRLALPLAPESAWSVFNWAPVAPMPSPLPPREIVIPSSPALPPIPSPAFPNPGLAPKSHPMVSRTQPPPKSAPRHSPWSYLAGVWLAGTALYGGRILLGTYLISRQLKRRTPLRSPEILSVLEACRRDMGVARAPEVWVAKAVDSPALFGLWHCRLLVPPHLPGTFSPAEWRHVFLHELAHLRRRDPQLNGFMLLLQALHWFNPLVWLAMRRMRADRELACDAAALACAPAADARAYGDTILKLLADSARPTFAPSLVGILEDKSLIKQRIRQIAGFKQTRRWPILAATLLASLCVFAMTDAQSPSPDKSGEQKAVKELVPAPEASKTASTSQEVSLKAAEIQAKLINVNTLVQDGRVLLEAGKLSEAEAKLEQAIKEDPNNMPAKYYRNLAKEAQFRQAESKQTPSNRGKLVQVEAAWNTPNANKLQPGANSVAQTNRSFAGPGQKLIKQKLEEIVLDQYPTTTAGAEIPLSKVLEELAEISRLHDPDKRGINFLISSHPFRWEQLDQNGNDTYAAKPSPPGAERWIDPLTGKPIPVVTNASPVMLNDLGTEVMVRITPTLRNVRLRDVLSAIEKCAECPKEPRFMGIIFSFEDYGVVCAQRTPEPEQLHNRLFRVDPNTFIQGLESSMNQTEIKDGMAIQNYVRQFFTIATGIKFGGTIDTNSPGVIGQGGSHPIRPMFFNNRTGMLFVRATTEELELVERVLSALNFPPTQINLKAQVFALDPTNAWVLQQALVKAGNAPGNPDPNNSASPLILTSAQFQVLTNQLYLVEPQCDISQYFPSVTTLEGREASFNPESREFTLSILPSTDPGTPIINLAIEFGLNNRSQTATNSLAADLYLSTTAQLIDNQTLVLQGLSASAPATGSKGKKLYVLCVTPTIIDPAGNRVYAEK